MTISEDFEAFLAEVIAETANSPDEIDAEGFVIDSNEKVEWFMKKAAEKASAIEVAKANMAAIIESMDGELKRFRTYFDPQVTAYVEAAHLNHQSNFKKDGSLIKKTFNFLFGKVAFRSVAAGFTVEDRSAIIEWAKANRPDLVVTKTIEDINLDAVKAEAAKELASSGDTTAIPGLRYNLPRESCAISPGSHK